MSIQPNLILDKSFVFAKEIVVFTDELLEKKKTILATQLLKSGTSIGANVHEAQSAESRADFIHKLKIAYKETEETHYWLKLIAEVYHFPKAVELQEDVIMLKKILNKIIAVSKSKLKP